jgi:hypothetical protein
MTDFCSLHIRSDVHGELPIGFLRKSNKMYLFFVDNESPERRASFSRVRKRGGAHTAPPRYHWSFSSEGHVEGFDVMKHLTWVLDQVQPGFLLSHLEDAGYQYWLQFFWEGNGTGGGPNVTAEIASLLVRHKANLVFGFYLAAD